MIKRGHFINFKELFSAALIDFSCLHYIKISIYRDKERSEALLGVWIVNYQDSYSVSSKLPRLLSLKLGLQLSRK